MTDLRIIRSRQPLTTPTAETNAPVAERMPREADGDYVIVRSTHDALKAVGTARSTLQGGIDCLAKALHLPQSWQRYKPRAVERSPSIPARVETPVSEGIPRALRGMTYTSPLDLNYEGDFVVPGRKNVAARFDQVMAQPNWPQFIRDHLSVGTARQGDPLRIYVSGLNTPIDENERRMNVIARETGYAFAQLDNATTDGLPEVSATVLGQRFSLPTRGREWTMAGLQRFGFHFPRGSEPYPKDSVRGALADLSDPNQQLVENTQKLILAYIDRDDKAPLELWGYSEGTLAVSMAMRGLEDRYLAERMRDCPPKEREARLAMLRRRFAERCDNIAAIFVGSAAAEWDAPIRRIDFFAAEWRDKVVLWAGPARRFAPVRNVVDAFDADGKVNPQIPYPQPFNQLDAHNLFASGAPALSVYMERNNVRTVRGLYDVYNKGTMVTPTLDEVNDRIRELGSVSELWDKENAKALGQRAPQ